MQTANKEAAATAIATAHNTNSANQSLSRKRHGTGKAPAVLPDPSTFDAVVPVELKRNNVVWLSELKDGRSTKVLFTADGCAASSTDPSTWFEYYPGAAADAINNGWDGLGTVMTGNGITGVDIDGCLNPDNTMKPAAQRIVDQLNSYTEYTPGGDSVRVYVKASMDGLDGHRFKCDGFEVEIYDRARFFTVTGRHVPGTPKTLENRQAELENVHAWAKSQKSRLTLTSSTITAKAPTDFDKLFHGDVDYLAERYPSDSDRPFDHSRADQALCNLLAAKFNGNYETIERMFLASALGEREKAQREDYRRSTITKAIESFRPEKSKEVDGNVDPEDWRSLFHSYDETLNAPPLKFAIDGFLQETGITFFGGLAGHGKTLIMLNAVKALLEGGKLWNEFAVNGTSKRVLYLIPESGLGPFVYRLKLFGLLNHVKEGRLFYRTLSARDGLRVGLDDPRILKAAEGADVFLDTAVRFMDGEENSASDHREFADMLFKLQANGARTIVGAHHSPKAFEKIESITLENALRGSGDVGAMLATCWAVRQQDAATNRLYIKNVKARDFEACKPFEIEGRPWIDKTGSFRMVAAPGMAVAPGSAASKKIEQAKARDLLAQGMNFKDIADEIGVNEKTVRRWNKEGLLAPKGEPTPFS